MISLLIVPPNVVVVVSTNGTSSVTVTTSFFDPVCSAASIRDFLTHFKQNILALENLKTLGLHTHRVGSWCQVRRNVLPGLIGGSIFWKLRVPRP